MINKKITFKCASCQDEQWLMPMESVLEVNADYPCPKCGCGIKLFFDGVWECSLQEKKNES